MLLAQISATQNKRGDVHTYTEYNAVREWKRYVPCTLKNLNAIDPRLEENKKKKKKHR